MPADGVLDAADVHEVGADAEDHELDPGAATRHGGAHVRDRSGEPNENRLAHQEMSDIQLDDRRYRSDRLCARIVEAMARMHFEAEAAGEPHAFADARPLGFGTWLGAGRQGVAPGAGMNLDRRGMDAGSRLDLPGIGGDEEGNAD